MAFFEESDITAMLDQIGESITIEGTTANAVVRVPDAELLRADEELAPLIGRIVELIAKTGAFPGMKIGSAVVRGSESYKVRRFLQQRDGAVVHALCATVG